MKKLNFIVEVAWAFFIIASMIYDATGSYRMAWFMWAAVNAVAIVVFIALNKMAEKDKK